MVAEVAGANPSRKQLHEIKQIRSYFLPCVRIFLFLAHILNVCLYLKAFIQIFVLPVSGFSPFSTLYCVNIV